MWVHGPFPCGEWPDISIFRDSLMHLLGNGERVEADNGYRGEPESVDLPEECVDERQREVKSRVRARHETMNNRLKNWSILSNSFRHPVEKHLLVFNSIAVITQLSIENGRPLFQVEYTTRL